MADAMADQLGLKVFVPDYIRESILEDTHSPQITSSDLKLLASPIPDRYLDSVMASYPGEFKNRSWYTSITTAASGIVRALPYLTGLIGLQGRAEQAVKQIVAEGYNDLSVIG